MTNKDLRARLLASAASLLLCGAVLAPAPAFAQAEPAIETSRYTIQAMTQSFDGEREHSQTQAIGFARMRRGNESWIELDFGDGATVIEDRDGVAAGRFANTSGIEAGLRYDYETRQVIGGSSVVERFHNTFVSRQLGRSPALGADARWSVSMMPAELGVLAFAAQPLTIELSRQYLTHGGRDLVLLHYRVPAFSYDSAGRSVVHWGEGAALTDPGFGTMYWNAALHRAVAEEAGGPARPYRQLKTLVALDESGRPVLDPRDIPQAAALLDGLYGHEAQEVMAFVEGEASDQTPLLLAGAIDAMALSIAEDSPNQLGELTSQINSGGNGTVTADGGSGSGGGTGQSGDGGAGSAPSIPLPTSGQILTAAEWQAQGINMTAELADKFAAIAEGLNVLVSESTRLSSRATELANDITRVREAIRQAPSATRPSTAFSALQRTYEATKAELASLEAVFDDLASSPTRVRPPPGMIHRYIDLTAEAMDQSAELAQMVARGESITVVPSARQLTLAENLQSKARSLSQVEASLASLAARAGRLQPLIQSLSQTEFAAMVRSFGASPWGKALSGVALGLNTATVYAGIANLNTGLNNDLSEGELQTTRNYGTGGSVAMLGLEIGAMAGNLYAGNMLGFFTDAAALTVGSVSDVVVAAKGVQDANMRAVEAEIAIYETESRVRRQRLERFERELALVGDEMREVREELRNFDRDVEARRNMAQQLLDERRRNRAEYERQLEEQRLAAEEEARRAEEAARRALELAEAMRTEPTPEEWEEFHRAMTELMRPDYPTVSAEERARISAEAAARQEAERRSELARQAYEAAVLAAEQARTAAERAAKLREARRIAEQAMARREAENRRRERWLQNARDRNFEISELLVTEFDIAPVIFDSPTWDPPEWFPPEWVPPEFDPPEISEIEWTDFDDDDWPDTGNLAFDFLNMSGTVETDLSRYAEWLATQNQRELERLALQAGYPNLASALADAENIIRQSQDEGYRRWAMQAPSCGGYVGCGPSYLERWAMKTSIVALGDILVQSREIFSSGGFSDVGISGSRLDYLLRDHGAQDGDIVQILIQQFGRTIYEGRLSLTNAGNEFTLPLRPGVASLTILAENEGSVSPNTAQISIDNVVSGSNVQYYNLLTNQTAVLRIETNAQGARP